MAVPVLVYWAIVAVIVFVLGTGWRLKRYQGAPVHLRWDLYPVAHEPPNRRRHGGSYLEEKEWWHKPRRRSLAAEAAYMAEEIFLLKGVFENNRRLWKASFPFHWGLYLLVVTTLAMAPLVFGVAWPGAAGVLRVTGTLGGMLLAAGAGGLLVLRSLDPELGRYTAPLDRLNLVLLTIFGLSSAAVALSPRGVAGAAAFLGAAARGEAVEAGPLLTAQIVLGGLFLCYMPFTRMIHMVAKYFTYHKVRWDDEPMEPGSAMARRVRAALEYGVDWSAGHVGAGRSWGEVATSTPAADRKGGD